MKKREVEINLPFFLKSTPRRPRPRERAPVGKRGGPAHARKLVEARNGRHDGRAKAQARRGRQDEAVARAPFRHKRGRFVAAAARQAAARPVAGEVGRERGFEPVVALGRHAVDVAAHVVQEGGALAAADLLGQGDAVGGAWRVMDGEGVGEVSALF